jgi:hypothetical protein
MLSLSVGRHREEVHGHIESIDERDVKEIRISSDTDSEFGKRDRRLPAASANEHATAVSRLTRTITGTIE